MRESRFAVLLLCATILCLVPLAANAQGTASSTGALDWRLSLGHSGWTVPSAWVPLLLELNQPIPNGRLELERGDRTGNQLSVETYPLPHAGRYEFPFFTDEFSARLTVRLLSGGTLLASRELRPGDRQFPGHLVLTVGLPSSLQQTLARLLEPREPVLVLSAGLAGLPSNALGWDALSLVALVDPGPVLSPAQSSALAQWLAAGGILVLLEARQGPASLGAALAGREGLGELVALAPGTPSPEHLLDSRWWQERIRLPPYEESGRLASAAVFNRSFEQPSGLAIQDRGTSAPMAAVAIWGGVVVLACALLRRRWLPLLLSASILFAIILLAGGTERFGWWDRGLVWHGRSLILPAGAGSLDQGIWWFERQAVLPGLDKQLSPWPAGLWLEQDGKRETGLADPGQGPASRWDHGWERPLMALCSAGVRRLVLAGWQPSTGPRTALVRLSVLDGSPRWQIRADDGRWREAEKVPEALVPDAPWLVHVAGLRPGLTWEAGTSPEDGGGSGLRWGRDGHTEGPVTWIEPQMPDTMTEVPQ